ncbi:MAG TPA: aldo/keto reductase [Thermoanaerobaculia bacterium]|nr:aldo/keto reductase [Thermoanaerobaculia bacterium]
MSGPRRPPPRPGLGTAPPRGLTARGLEPAIHAAIDAGCVLYDTAEIYGTEPLLGRALRERGVDRNSVELVTKLWQTNHAPEHVLEACRGSLRRLAVDVVDLYLVHAPESWRYCGPLEIAPDDTREAIESRAVPRDAKGTVEHGGSTLAQTWEAMLDLVRRGLARGVGLANVGERELAALEARGLAAPAAIEVELHPLRPQAELRRRCAQRGTRVLAQSPLAGAALLDHAVVRKLAAELAVEPARLLLRWHLDRGVEPIPGSSRPEHVRTNLSPLDSALPEPIASALDRLLHV